jgi:hypothetical protein
MRSQPTPSTGQSFPARAGCARRVYRGPAWANEAARGLYWAGETVILLLHVYAKNVQEDIDAVQKKILVQLRDQFMEDYRD